MICGIGYIIWSELTCWWLIRRCLCHLDAGLGLGVNHGWSWCIITWAEENTPESKNAENEWNQAKLFVCSIVTWTWLDLKIFNGLWNIKSTCNHGLRLVINLLLHHLWLRRWHSLWLSWWRHWSSRLWHSLWLSWWRHWSSRLWLSNWLSWLLSQSWVGIRCLSWLLVKECLPIWVGLVIHYIL